MTTQKRLVMVKIPPPYVDRARSALQILGAQRIEPPKCLTPAPEDIEREILIPIHLPATLLDAIEAEVGAPGTQAFDARLTSLVVSAITDLAADTTAGPPAQGAN